MIYIGNGSFLSIPGFLFALFIFCLIEVFYWDYGKTLPDTAGHNAIHSNGCIGTPSINYLSREICFIPECLFVPFNLYFNQELSWD